MNAEFVQELLGNSIKKNRVKVDGHKWLHFPTSSLLKGYETHDVVRAITIFLVVFEARMIMSLKNILLLSVEVGILQNLAKKIHIDDKLTSSYWKVLPKEDQNVGLSMTLLNDVGLWNIQIGCWELN